MQKSSVSTAERGDPRARAPSVRDLLRREWDAFRRDSAGERFRHHEERLRQPEYTVLRRLALVFGPVLIAVGVVLLFIPGPGLVFIVLGLALLCGRWRWLARQLDRAEPPVRRRARSWRDRWRKLRPRP
jgi:Flp pilus assembly protein TadB